MYMTDEIKNSKLSTRSFLDRAFIVELHYVKRP